MNIYTVIALSVFVYVGYVYNYWLFYLTKSNEMHPLLAHYFPRNVDATFDGKRWRTDDFRDIGDLLSRFLPIGALVFVFAVQHTVMARSSFKSFLIERIRFPKQLERSLYVLMSAVVLHLYLVATPQISTPMLYTLEGTPLKPAMQLLQTASIIGLVYAMFGFDFLDLMGIKQTMKDEDTTQTKKESKEKQQSCSVKTPLCISGIYSYIRHPIMTFSFGVFWCAYDMSLGHLIVSLCWTAYILIGVKYFEEPDLRCAFSSYAKYSTMVPAYFPTSLHSHHAELKKKIADVED